MIWDRKVGGSNPLAPTNYSINTKSYGETGLPHEVVTAARHIRELAALGENVPVAVLGALKSLRPCDSFRRARSQTPPLMFLLSASR